MMKDLPPSRTADQFVVRFPDGMRDRIAAEAKTAGRSMNAEIVSRLQKSFDHPTIEWKGPPIPGRSEDDVRLFNVTSTGAKLIAATLEHILKSTKDAEQRELLKYCEELARGLGEATDKKEAA